MGSYFAEQFGEIVIAAGVLLLAQEVKMLRKTAKCYSEIFFVRSNN